MQRYAIEAVAFYFFPNIQYMDTHINNSIDKNPTGMEWNEMKKH